MHHIQRVLVDVVADPRAARPDGTSLMPIQGTMLVVPVLDVEGVAAARLPIGVPGQLSGLVVADIEAPDVAEVLAREGLGARAGVTWDAGWHLGELEVHEPSLDAALGALAEGLRGAPDVGATKRSAPTGAAHAMAMAEWTASTGAGRLMAEPGDDWEWAIAEALAQVAAASATAAAAVEAVRVGQRRGEQTAAVLEAGPLRLHVWTQDYTPPARRG